MGGAPICRGRAGVRPFVDYTSDEQPDGTITRGKIVHGPHAATEMVSEGTENHGTIEVWRCPVRGCGRVEEWSV